MNNFPQQSDETKSSSITPTDAAPQFYQKLTPLYLVILLPHSFGDNDSRYFDNPRTLNIMFL